MDVVNLTVDQAADLTIDETVALPINADTGGQAASTFGFGFGFGF